MVTVIEVFVSSTDGTVDSCDAATSSGVGVNERQLLLTSNEDTKNHPTTLRQHNHNYEPPNISLRSVENQYESINGGGSMTTVTSTTNTPYSDYMSYAEIEATCSRVDTTTDETPYSVWMPPSRIISESTTTSEYCEAAAAKRPRRRRSGNQAFDFDFQQPPRFINNPQQQQQPKRPVQFSASSEEKTNTFTPKQQKLSKTKPNTDATATLKQTLNAITLPRTSLTPQTSHESSERKNSNYGQRGVTMRPSGKWQVQYYYCGKSRYMGVFESKMIALAAYETTREILGKPDDAILISADNIDSNIRSAREAVKNAIRKARKGGEMF
jgi:hypothetical protein